MKKRKSIPLIAWGALAVAILVALSIGGSPTVEGQFMQIRISDGAFQPASYLGDDTKLVYINLLDSEGDNYTFRGDGETVLNVPEDRIINIVQTSVEINDNYAGSTSEAKSRTKIEVIITDPSSNIQFAENFEGAENSLATYCGVNYYCVTRTYESNFTATIGTWDLDAEYFIYSLPV